MNPSAAPSPQPPAASRTATAGDPERKEDSGSCARASAIAVRSHQAVAVQPPGRDIRHWPCQLLELVLRHLDITDLAHASQTCRLWLQTASQRAVQARCLLNAYPACYRPQLQRPLASALAQQILPLWCQGLPAGCAQHEELAQLSEQPLPAAQLFYELTRQMLRAERIRSDDSNLGLPLAPSVPISLYSPDGRYLVTQGPLYHAQSLTCLAVWHLGTSGLLQAAPCLLELKDPHICYDLTFSADSRSLRVIGQRGHLQTWQLQADSSWQLATTRRPFPCNVTRAKFSPDSHWLALQVDTRLLILGETTAWQACCELQSTPAPLSARVTSSVPDTLEFTADSRHLLFISNAHAFVVDRQKNDWKFQQINPDSQATPYRAGQLSPSGDWLALLSLRSPPPWLPQFHSPRLEQLHQTFIYAMELWKRHDAEPHWRSVNSQAGICAGWPGPVVFSPDGRQLVSPHHLNNDNVCVLRLSLSQDGNWRLACPLDLSPRSSRHPLASQVFSLRFSAQGRYLVLAVGGGVQLWRCYPPVDWQPIAWIESRYSTPVCLFSPDGWHCAVSRGVTGQLTILGPGPGGRYLIKMQMTLDIPVRQMRFSPDGLRLLVSSLYRRRVSDARCAILLHLAPAFTENHVQAPPS
ncbi:MAG: F-box protein [Kistimonas sp.]|nr:F-box protein [Kistimonas sp.]